MSFEDDLTAVTQSLDAAAQAYHGKIGDINNRVATAEAEVDAKIAELDTWRDNSESLFMIPRGISEFDITTTMYKDTAGIEADPADPTKSKWLPVPKPTTSAHVGGRTSLGHKTMLSLDYAISTAPGHWENPQYSNDVSRTYMQFVVSNVADSDQINALIESEGIDIDAAGTGGLIVNSGLLGGWNSGSWAYEIPCLSGTYSALYVRFVNRYYDDVSVVNHPSTQSILTHGGNNGFRPNRLITFNT